MSANGTVSSVINLYIGLFGRSPDTEGLSYWVNQIDAGTPIATVAQDMYNTEAARPYYPLTLSDSEFITRVYQYVLGREPDSEGLNYWVSQLAGKSKGQLVVDMVTVAANYDVTSSAATPVGITAHNLFVNKEMACAALVQQQLNHGPFAGLNNNSVLTAVTSDPDTVAKLFGIAPSDLVTVASNAVTEFSAEHTDLNYGFEPPHSTDHSYLIANSTRFAIGGSLNQSGQTDVFRVTLEADHTYQIRAETATGNPLDPQISWVRNPGGSIIDGVANTDYGLSRSAQISFTPSAGGEYQIGIQAQHGTSGSYWLGLADLTGTIAAADPISASANSSYTVSIDHSFATRKVTFDLAGGQEYQFSLAATAGGNPLDSAQIQGIYDASGKALVGSSVSATNGSASLLLTPASDGSYYAIVKDGFDDTGVCQFSYSAVSTAKSAASERSADTSTADLAGNTGTTGSITTGGATTGVISTSGDQDWYATYLTAGQAYTVSLQGSGSSHGTLYDPVITGIYNSSGSYISGTYADDSTTSSGISRDSLLVFTPSSSGTYYVAAAGYGSYTGTYTLSVTQQTANDVAGNATTTAGVGVGSSTTGTVNSAGDHDWYAVSLLAGNTYTINLQGSATSHGTLSDPLIYGIYTSTSSYVSGTYADDTATSADSQLVFSPTSSGTYFIDATGYGSNTGTYTLSVSSPTSTDLPASTATTGSVSVGSSTTSNIGVPGDIDWFAVTLSSGSRYTIDLQGSASNHGTLEDPVINGIYNSSGTFISGTYADDSTTSSGSSRDALLVFTPSSSGTYYVAAAGYGSYSGTYSLSVTQQTTTDVAGNATTTAGVGVGSSTTGTINSAGDHDWYAVSLLAGNAYTINLQGSATSHGTLSDPLIYGIYTSTSSYVSGTYADDTATSSDSQLVFTPSSSGTYFIDATGYGSSAGTFTLSVSSPTSTDLPASTTTTGGISVGGSVIGTTNYSSDQDWYAVSLLGGNTYAINLQGSDSSHGTLYDPVISGIYNSGGTYISGTSADDSYTSSGSFISHDSQTMFTPASSGTYYISAAGYGSSTGTYTLSVAQQTAADVPGDATTTASVNVAGSATGTINSAGDHDWYAVSLLAGNTYTINLQGSASSHGTLYDPLIFGIYTSGSSYVSGTYADDSYANGGTYSSLDAQTYFTPTTSGTYFIDATGYGSGTGTYTLSVSSPTSTDLAASTATTGSISVGGSASGIINYAADQDWYAATLTAGHTYSVALQGSNSSHGSLYDPVIYGIYNASGNLASNTYADGGYTNSGSYSSLDAQENFTPTTSGTYYISAAAYSSYTGSYTLSLAETVSNSELPASTATTGIAPVNGQVADTIDFSGDRDWFAVSLLASHRYQIDLLGSATGNGTLSDPYLYGVYTSAGTLLANSSDDDSGDGANARVSIESPSSGTYYVSAGAYGSSTGTCMLSVTDLGVSDIAANIATTATLSAGGSASSNIYQAGDQDWFAVQLSSGYQYTISLNASTNSQTPLGDPYFAGVYGSTGNLISGTSNDDSGGSLNSQVVFSPSTSGTYYLAATGYSNYTGDYTLSVGSAQAVATSTPPPTTTTSDVAANATTTARITAGGSATCTVNPSGDRDWYTVSLTAGHSYDISLNGHDSNGGTLADPYLYGIYNSSSVLQSGTQDDDSGVGSDAFVSYTPTVGGTYYISAGGYGSATGTATLSIADTTQTDTTSPPPTTSPPTTGSTGTWTIMVYIDGDNNLEPAALKDVNEMEAATLPSGVRVSVLLDRAPGYSSADGNWTDTRFGLISHDNNINSIGSSLTSLGERNVGSPATLTDFINRSVAAAPASHYALVLWDHGGGIRGVTWDDSSNSDNLSLNEVNQAIGASNVTHFDVLGYDACLMAVLDQYNAVRSRADYIVASENTEPNDGWDYTSWLGLFSGGSNISAQQLANRAADTYAQFYANDSSAGATLSTVASAQVSSLTSTWSSFTQAVVNAGSSAMATFKAAAAESLSWETNYFDLNNLMSHFINRNNVTSLDQAAQSVIDAVSAAVVDSAGLSAARGMTVFLPGDSYTYTNGIDYPLLQLAGVQSFYHMYTA